MEQLIAFYDTKPYDKVWFCSLPHSGIKFKFFEHKLNSETAKLAYGCSGVVAFVNDDINSETIDKLYNMGIKVEIDTIPFITRKVEKPSASTNRQQLLKLVEQHIDEIIV